ncbi:MAG TPA: hypothetical protein VE084_10470 [Burkholderiaceae bacterium]|nr:hypothetical protein [Burkholderiaceae bacterium]
MNPDWNTPPGGDFARYVEQLTARSLRQVSAPQSHEHQMDVGMGESVPAPPARAPASPAATAGSTAARPAGNEGAMRGLARSLAIGWAGLLLVLLSSGATVAALGVLVGGLWAGFHLRRWLLPPGGTAGLKAALEDMARQQAAQNRQGKKKS